MNNHEYRQLIGDGKSQLELTFAYQLSQEQIPQPVREYRFNPKRKWRFDFAFIDPAIKLAIEIEGGTYKKSRHTSARGFKADCEKYNQAALMGWIVLRFDAAMVNNLEAINTTLHAFDVLKAKKHSE